jgi:hypothetical protein
MEVNPDVKSKNKMARGNLLPFTLKIMILYYIKNNKPASYRICYRKVDK